MSSKFSRFLHLERSRADRSKPEEQPQLESSSRFETLAQRGEVPQGAVVPEAHLERFRGEAPLALAEEPSEEELQFPRCGSCESDNGRFTKECVVCGADLTTPQQRAYNKRLWQTRKQDQLREREASAALSQQKHDAERQADQARYARMMTKLREEEQSSAMWNLFLGDGSFGLKLLGLIPNSTVRLAIFLLSIVIPVALWRLGEGRVRSAGVVMGLIVVALFLPARSRSRRWWR